MRENGVPSNVLNVTNTRYVHEVHPKIIRDHTDDIDINCENANL